MPVVPQFIPGHSPSAIRLASSSVVVQSNGTSVVTGGSFIVVDGTAVAPGARVTSEASGMYYGGATRLAFASAGVYMLDMGRNASGDVTITTNTAAGRLLLIDNTTAAADFQLRVATARIIEMRIAGTGTTGQFVVTRNGTGMFTVAENGALTASPVSGGAISFTTIAAAITIQTTTSGTLALSSAAAFTLAAGVSSDIISSSAIKVTGVAQVNTAASTVMDYSSGGRILINGVNASTNGQLAIVSQRSDGTNSITVATFPSTGVTLGATLKFGAASGVIGFSVVSTAYTLGSAGTVILPNANMSGAANDAARDVLAGNIDGAIAIDTGVAGRVYIRDGGAWKFALFA